MTTEALGLDGGDEDIQVAMNAIIDVVWEQAEPSAQLRGATRETFGALLKNDRDYQMMMATLEFEYAAISNFKTFGAKTYHFSENLVERLAFTELNVAAEVVVPPFRSCLFVYDDDTTRAALSGLGRASRSTPATAPINVFVNYMPTDVGGFTLAMLVFHGDDQNAHMLVKRQLHLAAGQRVEDALRTDWNKLLPSPASDEERFEEDIFSSAGLQFFRIVVNSILYLGSSSPDISAELLAKDVIKPVDHRSNKTERRKFEYEVSRASQLPYIVVGGVVRPMVRPSGPRTAVLSKTRSLVSGHWKEQAHGPQRSLRKLIHVEPYFRGPEMADLVDRPFVVR